MSNTKQDEIRQLFLLVKAAPDTQTKEMRLREVLRLDIQNNDAWEMISQIKNPEQIRMEKFREQYLAKYPLRSRKALENIPTQPRLSLSNSQTPIPPVNKSIRLLKLLALYVPLLVAIVTGFVAVIIELIKKDPTIPAITTPTLTYEITNMHLMARIANDRNQPIAGANVAFVTDLGKVSVYSDSNGYVSMKINTKSNEGRLFVEAESYAAYDQLVALPSVNLVDVRLSPIDPNNRTLVLRISDSRTHLPVEGAEIMLFIGDQMYLYTTDTNGTTPRFPLAFKDKNEIDADISIKTSEYEFKHVRILLQPERLQELTIDPNGIQIVDPVNVNVLPSITPTIFADSSPVVARVTEIIPPAKPEIIYISVTSADVSTQVPEITFTYTPTLPPSATPTYTPVPVPAPPVLVSPDNLSGQTAGYLNLTWNMVGNATEYYVEYSGPVSGNSGWINSTNLNIGPLSLGVYNWRVKARNLAGESSWSELWAFSFQPPVDVWVHVRADGFEFSGMTGWVEIRSQNTVKSAIDANVIYTRTRTVGYTNDADWARWRPAFTIAGYYRVCIFAPWYTNTVGITNKARYLIHHSGGDSNPPEYPTRQSDYSNGWMDLGRYQFNAGNSGFVYLGDYTGDDPTRLVSADAAKFIWAPLGTEKCQ